MDPINERYRTYECCPLEAIFTYVTTRHSYDILSNYNVGISVHFRGKANKHVAEHTINWVDYQIWQIG